MKFVAIFGYDVPIGDPGAAIVVVFQIEIAISISNKDRDRDRDLNFGDRGHALLIKPQIHSIIKYLAV